MAKNSSIYLITALAFIVCNIKCNSRNSSADIIASMNHYDRLLEKMNYDSIALQYTPDGELGDVAKGRDSIKTFLKKFSDYKVLSNNSITDSVKISGDIAIQKGAYTQVTILPSQDTVHLKGQFEAHWIWQSKDGWKILRMITNPVP